MSGHLSEKEISRCLVEGPSADAEEHLRGCWGCQAKLAEAHEPLAVFRTALVGWSEAQADAGLSRRMALTTRKSVWNWAPTFGLSFALALLVAGVAGPSVYHWELARHAARTQVSDAALMEQVDAEVSEAVPDAMAPLTDLVAWDSGESAVDATSTDRQAMKGKSAGAVSHRDVTD